jgi:hypothetical protein
MIKELMINDELFHFKNIITNEYLNLILADKFYNRLYLIGEVFNLDGRDICIINFSEENNPYLVKVINYITIQDLREEKINDLLDDN